MRRTRPFLRGGFAGLALLLASPATALETDQFLTWSVELADVRPLLNAFVNERLRFGLAAANAAGAAELPCADVPPRLYRDLHFNLFSSRLRRWLGCDDRLARFPGPEVGYFGYVGLSIFRRPAFPFLLPMARTVRFAGIDVGIDKFGHFFGFGRRYYVRYRGKLARGKGEDAAMREVVVWGARIEDSLVGRMTDGVFSHADLEANFQGFRLARELCEARPPYLERDAAGWRLAREVDLADYVNPNFDETFNGNYFAPFRWQRVDDIVEREYCPLYRSGPVQARMRRYAARAAPSFSMRILEERYAGKRRRVRHEQELAQLCGGGGWSEATAPASGG